MLSKTLAITTSLTTVQPFSLPGSTTVRRIDRRRRMIAQIINADEPTVANYISINDGDRLSAVAACCTFRAQVAGDAIAEHL